MADPERLTRRVSEAAPTLDLMTTFGPQDDLHDAEFVDADLTGARFRFADLGGARIEQSSLTGAVMRGVDLTDADLDGQIHGLRVNDVEVLPLVEAELNRRFPGREHARSPVLDEQRASFGAALLRWDALTARAGRMPAGTVDESVDGEWSLAQTLRHLVFGIDVWLRSAVQGRDDAFHPLGVPVSEEEDGGRPLGIDPTARPTWSQVLEAHADRVTQVQRFHATCDAASFAATARRPPVWDTGGEARPVWTCLGVVVAEHWAHLQFAERDLDRLAARTAPGAGSPPS